VKEFSRYNISILKWPEILLKTYYEKLQFKWESSLLKNMHEYEDGST